jgi:hypothetical protein
MYMYFRPHGQSCNNLLVVVDYFLDIEQDNYIYIHHVVFLIVHLHL